MFYDWLTYLWPQIMNPLSLHDGIFNVPWLFVILQPLRLLGPTLAILLLQFLAVLVIIRVGYRLRVPIWMIVLVIFSPPVAWGFFMGQFDGLYLIAFLLPAPWAMAVSVLKPQTSIGAAWGAFREKPWVIAIPVVMVVSAYAIWGWPLTISRPPLNSSWSWSCWPWGLICIPLLFLKDWRGGMFVSPFLFPYAAVQSLIGPILVVASLNRWVFVVCWIASWIKLAHMLHML